MVGVVPGDEPAIGDDDPEARRPGPVLGRVEDVQAPAPAPGRVAQRHDVLDGPVELAGADPRGVPLEELLDRVEQPVDVASCERRRRDGRRALAQLPPQALGHVVHLDRGDVPLREHDEGRAARLARLVGHGQVALRRPLGRVDEHERDVGPLRRLEPPPPAPVLDSLAMAAFAPKARRVDQPVADAAALERGVDRVPRRPRRRRDDHAGAAEDGVQERRLADVGPAEDRNPDLVGLALLAAAAVLAGLGKPADDGVKEVAGSWAASSILFARTSTGRRDLRRMSAISSSPATRPARASITSSTRSASSTASRACAATWACMFDASAVSRPPVSTSTNSRPPHSHTTSFRSRVTPGVSSTTAVREPVSRFTSVDLPAFGNPTTATTGRRVIGRARTGAGSRPSAPPPSPGTPRRRDARPARTSAARRTRSPPGGRAASHASPESRPGRPAPPRPRRTGPPRPWRPPVRPGDGPG